MRVHGYRRLAAAALAVVSLLAASMSVWVFLSTSAPASELAAPSTAGLNYAFPHTIDGQWVGTEWLRSEAIGGSWEKTRPALAADLDFIQQHDLGKVVRLFIGLDQAMVWDGRQRFDGFDESTLQHLTAAFDMLDAHGIRAVAVIYDQEQVGSKGNFRFDALDGSHPAMREDYLRATGLFLQRFGSRSTVIGWDLFNEAYNSLGQDGHLPSPPHADPVSPNYSDQVVHAWLLDLYHTAKSAAPQARFTVSDATELYWNPDPDVAKYQDVVDFYDIHVYDDSPHYPNWRSLLHKPYIVGEAGASTAGQHYDDQALNSSAVTYLLGHSQSAGVSFVLVQGQAFSTDRATLTPTGMVLAQFLASHPGGPVATAANPVDVLAAGAVGAARRVKRFLFS